MSMCQLKPKVDEQFFIISSLCCPEGFLDFIAFLSPDVGLLIADDAHLIPNDLIHSLSLANAALAPYSPRDLLSSFTGAFA